MVELTALDGAGDNPGRYVSAPGEPHGTNGDPHG